MERILTINLREVYKKPSTKRGRCAIKLLREKIAKYTKQKIENVKIDNALNKYVTKNFKKPKRKVKVKVTIDEKGAIAYLA